MNASRSRVVFIDLDGTLVDFAGRIARSSIRAIRTAQRNGHVVVLCTGRSRAEIPQQVWDIGFDGAVTSGGGVIEIEGMPVSRHVIPNEVIEAMVSHFTASGWLYCLYSPQGLHPSEGMTDRFQQIAQQAFGAGLPPAPADATQVSPLSHPLLVEPALAPPNTSDEIVKALFLNDSREGFEEFRAAYADQLYVLPASVPGLGAGSGELTAIGVTKGAAVRRVLSHLGASPAQSVGIGDSFNDLDMLRACGVGVAMAGAEAEVRSAADYVTTGVLDHGIWNALEQFGLIEE